jgi:hypothetical protein
MLSCCSLRLSVCFVKPWIFSIATIPSRNVVKFLTIWLTLDELPPAGVKIDREGGDIESRRCRSIAKARVFEPIACSLAELEIEADMAAVLFYNLKPNLNFLKMLKKAGGNRKGPKVVGTLEPPVTRVSLEEFTIMP